MKTRKTNWWLLLGIGLILSGALSMVRNAKAQEVIIEDGTLILEYLMEIEGHTFPTRHYTFRNGKDIYSMIFYPPHIFGENLIMEVRMCKDYLDGGDGEREFTLTYEDPLKWHRLEIMNE